MLQSHEWKIYYEHSEFSGDPFEAPALGVVCIAQANPTVGRRIVVNHDYYWWGGEWFGGDIAGLFQHLVTSGPKRILLGAHINNERYREIVKRALADPGLPPKSARMEGENF